MIDEQLNLAIESAREAAQRGDFGNAVEVQERVVAHIRLKAQTPDDVVTLGVQMFNLADYYTGVERFEEAIRLMEEVVALDERIGHPDIDSDRQMLAQVRQLAGMSPDARRQFYASTPQSQPTVSYLSDPVKELVDQLDGLSPEEKEDLQKLVREMHGLPPEEQVRRALEAMKGKGNLQ